LQQSRRLLQATLQHCRRVASNIATLIDESVIKREQINELS
jgi:hypothetical protein